MGHIKMTIQYFGKNLEEDRKYPEAQICYDENREEERANKLIDILKDMGWNCVSECEVVVIPLYNGKDEYLQLVKDYKEVKKKLRRSS